tara:strand:+ start:168 stop:899 length:732 start_codon:yes stop_codon:yes gene_type:complete
MICKGCGKKVDTNKKFCTNCGWKIEFPVAKVEEVKKEIKKEKKEVFISNKSTIEKQGSFFKKFSSNLQQKSPADEIEKGKPIKTNEISENEDSSTYFKKYHQKKGGFFRKFFSNLKQKPVKSQVENKSNKLNYFLLALLGMVSLGCVIGLAQYIGSVTGSDIYEELESETSWSAEDVYSLVGGEQKYEELLEWVSDNLSEVEIDDFNKLIDNYDFNSIKSAVLDLQKRRLNYFENIDKNSLID